MKKKCSLGISLFVQWLRLLAYTPSLTLQRIQVQSLVCDLGSYMPHGKKNLFFNFNGSLCGIACHLCFLIHNFYVFYKQ